MSIFLCKARFHYCIRNLTRLSSLGILRNQNVRSLRLFSSSSSSDQEHSFTVSYLIGSLGFSPKAALSASKHVTFETREKPDKVIRLLEDYGFTQTQISTLFRRRPSLLVSDSEKTILPKLEFLEAKGISWPKMAKGVSVFPNIFHSSLEKQIIPAYEFFRSVFNSDKKLISAIQQFPDLLAQNVGNYVVPNVAILRGHGVPDSNIAKLIWIKPRAVILSSDKFSKIVEQVVEMRFSTSRATFVYAVSVFLSMRKSTWESKVSAYKKWGWSDEEVLKAFESYPQFMTISLDKITAVMDFLVNEMGFRPCHIVKYPVVLSLSLEKRLRPRHFVLRALVLKGLVKKAPNLNVLFGSAEEKFLQKFVMPYEDEAPELMKLYKDKLGLST